MRKINIIRTVKNTDGVGIFYSIISACFLEPYITLFNNK